jgi:hypothetical protein
MNGPSILGFVNPSPNQHPSTRSTQINMSVYCKLYIREWWGTHHRNGPLLETPMIIPSTRGTSSMLSQYLIPTLMMNGTDSQTALKWPVTLTVLSSLCMVCRSVSRYSCASYCPVPASDGLMVLEWISCRTLSHCVVIPVCPSKLASYWSIYRSIARTNTSLWSYWVRGWIETIPPTWISISGTNTTTRHSYPEESFYM